MQDNNEYTKIIKMLRNQSTQAEPSNQFVAQLQKKLSIEASNKNVVSWRKLGNYKFGIGGLLVGLMLFTISLTIFINTPLSHSTSDKEKTVATQDSVISGSNLSRTLNDEAPRSPSAFDNYASGSVPIYYPANIKDARLVSQTNSNATDVVLEYSINDQPGFQLNEAANPFLTSAQKTLAVDAIKINYVDCEVARLTYCDVGFMKQYASWDYNNRYFLLKTFTRFTEAEIQALVKSMTTGYEPVR